MRIEPLEPQKARQAAEAAGVPQVRISTNIFRVLLQHGAIADVAHRAVSALLNGRLDFRLQELVILRIAWRTGCSYQWSQHYRRATQPTWESPSDPQEPDRR